MDIAPHPFPLAAVLPRREEHRLVFALVHDSRSKAQAAFREQDFAGAECQWLEHADMSRDNWEHTLRKLQPTVLVIGWGSPRLPDSIVDDADFPLRYVCHLAGTVREFLPRRLVERGVLVSNWGNSISHTVAEHALLLTLSALRNQPRWTNYLREEWHLHRQPPRRATQTRTLCGKRVGIHGFGAVARALVRYLRPFGVEIAAYSHGVPAKVYAQHGVEAAPSLEALFARSEVLVECEALSPVNTGSVTYDVLSRLPEGAVFVNVARGALVDEEALIRVAREKSLRLGLDVFAKEPLPRESALFELPDVVLSPHIAGPTEDAFSIMWSFACRNLQAYLAGDESSLEGLVTPEIYDRTT
jgi:phosphoglycerate dehydrogenase-like enzyme